MAKMLDGFSERHVYVRTGNYFTPQYSGSQAEASSGNTYHAAPTDFTQPLKGPGR
jgi:hypothetical protein